VSLYHKTLMLNLILYSSEITDIIQLILMCHQHVAPLFKDTSYSSLISVVTTYCVGEAYWAVVGKWPMWCTNSFLCIYFYL